MILRLVRSHVLFVKMFILVFVRPKLMSLCHILSNFIIPLNIFVGCKRRTGKTRNFRTDGIACRLMYFLVIAMKLVQ